MPTKSVISISWTIVANRCKIRAKVEVNYNNQEINAVYYSAKQKWSNQKLFAK